MVKTPKAQDKCNVVAMYFVLDVIYRRGIIKEAASRARIGRPPADNEAQAYSGLLPPLAVEARLYPTESFYGNSRLTPTSLQQDEKSSTADDCSADLDWPSISEDSECLTAESSLVQGEYVQRALELSFELFKHWRQCQVWGMSCKTEVDILHFIKQY
jgi:hypothetical protein